MDVTGQVYAVNTLPLKAGSWAAQEPDVEIAMKRKIHAFAWK
jgi:hypothetical protein